MAKIIYLCTGFLNQEGRQKKILAAFDESLPSEEWEEIPQPTQQIIETNRDSKNEESDETTQFSLDSF